MPPCGIQSRTGRHGSAAGFLEGAPYNVPNNLKVKCKLCIKHLTMVVDPLELPRGQNNGYVKALLLRSRL